MKALSLCALLLFCVNAEAGEALTRIRATNTLICGINQEEAEFSTSDDHGAREAFDLALCKAVAVAILGPGAKTATLPYPDDRASMEALRSGKVDLLPTQTADFAHAAPAGIGFSRPVLYDGLGLLVAQRSGIVHAKELGGHKICVLAETESEVSLRAWFTARKLDFVPFPFQEEGEMEAAFATGNCTALAGDRTRLANTRLGVGARAKDYRLLPELLSRDPLAMAWRAADDDLGRIAAWTLEILVDAEEDGVTQQNAHVERTSEVESISRLLGRTHELGAPLGLDPDWALKAIEAVGNYGEIFERTLGDKSPMHLPRSLNDLWSRGGLMYGLPLK